MLDAPSHAVPLEVIPNHFIFIWYGRTLPTFAFVAIRSALSQNPGSTASLFHEPDLAVDPDLITLTARGLRLTVLNIEALARDAQQLSPTLDTTRLVAIYRQLTASAARANLVRLLALYTLGGVYLDTDTLTLLDLTDLRQSGAFLGVERILFPEGISKFNLKAIMLGELRRVCALVPHGYRIDKQMHSHYSLAANNAVIGATAVHPFILALLNGIVRMADDFVKRRFVLGTHLLQQTLSAFGERPDTAHQVTVLDPAFFYPLGPMISRHYFRRYLAPASVLNEVTDSRTHIIHWYASVSELDGRDRAFILKNADRELFSHLCRPYLEQS